MREGGLEHKLYLQNLIFLKAVIQQPVGCSYMECTFSVFITTMADTNIDADLYDDRVLLMIWGVLRNRSYVI